MTLSPGPPPLWENSLGRSGIGVAGPVWCPGMRVTFNRISAV
jgi:hypothetical protein